MAPLLVEYLRARSRPIPAELAAEARAQLARGLKTRAFTLAVVDALTAAGTSPLLLKGYALAVRLYPELPLARPQTDVDVLVPPGRLDTAVDAVRRLGLGRIEDPGLDDALEEHHHLSYAGPAGLVELHFRLFQGFGGGEFDGPGLEARSRAFTLDGRAVRLLGPEDEFIYLATHAANHTFLRLSWLVDLQRYVALEPDLDFALMAHRARAAGFFRAVRTSLGLVQRLLDVTLPASASEAFDLGAPSVVDRILFSAPSLTSARVATSRVGGFLARWSLVDSPAAAVRYGLEGSARALRRAGWRRP